MKTLKMYYTSKQDKTLLYLLLTFTFTV